VFRLTKKEEPKYRKKITTTPYFMVETRKDGVKFSTQKLKRLSDTYIKLTEEYNTTQKELVGTVVGIAASFVEVCTLSGSFSLCRIMSRPDKESKYDKGKALPGGHRRDASK
jgi:hypothetical protein